MKLQQLTGYRPTYPKKVLRGAALTAAALVVVGGVTGCRSPKLPELQTEGMVAVTEPPEEVLATDGEVAIPEPTAEELILEGDTFLKTLGIGSDNNRACTVEMSRAIVTGETKIGWKSGAVRSFPAAEGVRYVWLNARGSAPMIFDPGSLGKYGPIAAVKTESAQAELSLVLEEAPQNWKWISGTEQFVPATFRLTAKEQDGWTLFSVDYQALMESFDAHEGVWNKETPAYTAFCWLRRFLENGQVDRAELRDWPARFELTLRDGSGAAKTIILSP